jgi:putative colanic acid biosynthesis UDP-glucose lipid carrier transferase
MAAQRSPEPVPVPASLNVLTPLVALFDLAWIALLGSVTGMLYNAITPVGGGDIEPQIGVGLAVALLFSAFGHAGGLYKTDNLVRRRWQIGRAMLVWLMVFLFLACLAFLLKVGASFSRGQILVFFVSGLVGVAVTRLLIVQLSVLVIHSGAFRPNRIVLIGLAEEFASNPALPRLAHYGHSVQAKIALPANSDQLDAAERRRLLREVIRRVREIGADEIVLALPWTQPELISETERELRVLPIPIKLVPDSMLCRVLERPLCELGPTKAVQLQRAPLSAAERALKQGIDRVLAAAGIVALLPMFAVIGAAVRLESRGPVLFLQQRVGFNGRPFRIFKFRTMTTVDDGAVIVQATRNDKRVTSLGKLLRKLSIDEVPQLFNVLRGEMSLVGPRPHALAHDTEYDRLIASYAQRQKMKPGITGWAQINGFRGETPELGMMQRRVESDLWYIESWSLWLDIRILLATIIHVVKSDRAY